MNTAQASEADFSNDVFSSIMKEIFMEPANRMRSVIDEETARCNGGCGPGECAATR